MFGFASQFVLCLNYSAGQCFEKIAVGNMQMMGVARFDQRGIFYQYLPLKSLSVALHSLSLLYWMLAMPCLLTQPNLLCRRSVISQLSHDVSGWNATELLWNTGATEGQMGSGVLERKIGVKRFI